MKISGLICRTNKAKNGNGNVAEEEENEGLAMLIPNIQETAKIVKIAAERLQKLTGIYNYDNIDNCLSFWQILILISLFVVSHISLALNLSNWFLIMILA